MTFIRRVTVISLGTLLAAKYLAGSKVNIKVVPDSKVTRAVQSGDSLKLKSVQVFFRHGARTPLRHIAGIDEVGITIFLGGVRVVIDR